MNPKSKLLQTNFAKGWKYQWDLENIDLRKKRMVQDYHTTLTLFKYEEEKVAKSIPKEAKLTTYYSIKSHYIEVAKGEVAKNTIESEYLSYLEKKN
jgi:hypothetical protein